MKIYHLVLLCFYWFCCATWAENANITVPNLPIATSNNAVAVVNTDSGIWWLSFMGLGATKDAESIHNRVFAWQVGADGWQEKHPVPASTKLTGRLASIAIGIDNYAYVFGGYTVAEDHTEVSSPDNFRYDVIEDKYIAIAPMPVPVDDSVALAYQNRYIYLVSGWHNDGNVNLVQVYDTQTNTWFQASPFPGKAVFGHSGAIVKDTLVICDGVAVNYHRAQRRNFAIESACYLGVINPTSPDRISWHTLDHPTGQGRYRMAGTGYDNSVYFIGGSANPYNYSGVGYNGIPSEPVPQAWQFDVATKKWQVSDIPAHTMDHRGLIELNGKFYVIGGMGVNQSVLKSTTEIRLKN